MINELMRMRNLGRYVVALESLNPENIDILVTLVAEDVVFFDPFNDTQGKKAFHKIFSDMLLKMKSHDFHVTQTAISAPVEGVSIAFLKWELDAVISKSLGGSWHVKGCSEIHFSPQGLVTAHIDFWDVGRDFYEKIPIFGKLVRFIRGRLKS